MEAIFGTLAPRRLDQGREHATQRASRECAQLESVRELVSQLADPI